MNFGLRFYPTEGMGPKYNEGVFGVNRKFRAGVRSRNRAEESEERRAAVRRNTRPALTPLALRL